MDDESDDDDEVQNDGKGKEANRPQPMDVDDLEEEEEKCIVDGVSLGMESAMGDAEWGENLEEDNDEPMMDINRGKDFSRDRTSRDFHRLKSPRKAGKAISEEERKREKEMERKEKDARGPNDPLRFFSKGVKLEKGESLMTLKEAKKKYTIVCPISDRISEETVVIAKVGPNRANRDPNYEPHNMKICGLQLPEKPIAVIILYKSWNYLCPKAFPIAWTPIETTAGEKQEAKITRMLSPNTLFFEGKIDESRMPNMKRKEEVKKFARKKLADPFFQQIGANEAYRCETIEHFRRNDGFHKLTIQIHPDQVVGMNWRLQVFQSHTNRKWSKERRITIPTRYREAAYISALCHIQETGVWDKRQIKISDVIASKQIVSWDETNDEGWHTKVGFKRANVQAKERITFEDNEPPKYVSFEGKPKNHHREEPERNFSPSPARSKPMTVVEEAFERLESDKVDRTSVIEAMAGIKRIFPKLGETTESKWRNRYVQGALQAILRDPNLEGPEIVLADGSKGQGNMDIATRATEEAIARLRRVPSSHTSTNLAPRKTVPDNRKDAPTYDWRPPFRATTEEQKIILVWKNKDLHGREIRKRPIKYAAQDLSNYFCPIMEAIDEDRIDRYVQGIPLMWPEDNMACEWEACSHDADLWNVWRIVSVSRKNASWIAQHAETCRAECCILLTMAPYPILPHMCDEGCLFPHIRLMPFLRKKRRFGPFDMEKTFELTIEDVHENVRGIKGVLKKFNLGFREDDIDDLREYNASSLFEETNEFDMVLFLHIIGGAHQVSPVFLGCDGVRYPHTYDALKRWPELCFAITNILVYAKADPRFVIWMGEALKSIYEAQGDAKWDGGHLNEFATKEIYEIVYHAIPEGLVTFIKETRGREVKCQRLLYELSKKARESIGRPLLREEIQEIRDQMWTRVKRRGKLFTLDQKEKYMRTVGCLPPRTKEKVERRKRAAWELYIKLEKKDREKRKNGGKSIFFAKETTAAQIRERFQKNPTVEYRVAPASVTAKRVWRHANGNFIDIEEVNPNHPVELECPLCLCYPINPVKARLDHHILRKLGYSPKDIGIQKETRNSTCLSCYTAYICEHMRIQYLREPDFESTSYENPMATRNFSLPKDSVSFSPIAMPPMFEIDLEMRNRVSIAIGEGEISDLSAFYNFEALKIPKNVKLLSSASRDPEGLIRNEIPPVLTTPMPSSAPLSPLVPLLIRPAIDLSRMERIENEEPTLVNEEPTLVNANQPSQPRGIHWSAERSPPQSQEIHRSILSARGSGTDTFWNASQMNRFFALQATIREDALDIAGDPSSIVQRIHRELEIAEEKEDPKRLLARIAEALWNGRRSIMREEMKSLQSQVESLTNTMAETTKKHFEQIKRNLAEIQTINVGAIRNRNEAIDIGVGRRDTQEIQRDVIRNVRRSARAPKEAHVTKNIFNVHIHPSTKAVIIKEVTDNRSPNDFMYPTPRGKINKNWEMRIIKKPLFSSASASAQSPLFLVPYPKSQSDRRPVENPLPSRPSSAGPRPHRGSVSGPGMVQILLGGDPTSNHMRERPNPRSLRRPQSGSASESQRSQAARDQFRDTYKGRMKTTRPRWRNRKFNERNGVEAIIASDVYAVNGIVRGGEARIDPYTDHYGDGPHRGHARDTFVPG